MFYWDYTSCATRTHASGLQRVSKRLLHELQLLYPGRVTPVIWNARRQTLEKWPNSLLGRDKVQLKSGNILVTPSVFAESEREGWNQNVLQTNARCYAVYHDAIPLRHPEFTWPHSVERHPYYMQELSRYKAVFAVSDASAKELLGYWKWQQLASHPPVVSFPLGADYAGQPRQSPTGWGARAAELVCVGILEPRKNQTRLLEAMEILHQRKRRVVAHLVGRANPHFGKPIVKYIESLQAKGVGIVWHSPATDNQIHALYKRVRCAVFCSLAEGNGLPVMEALWEGVPVVSSSIPATDKLGPNHGVTKVNPHDAQELASAIESILFDEDRYQEMTKGIMRTQLPSWSVSAAALWKLTTAS
ncbi:MAG: glycosyltransferase [Verrucomicrobiota bacterium]|nr:glycosyltransferase [Verrucomicrobiota bacterium]